jgi:hypothetical protein
MRMNLLAIDYHRNGICGQGFWVILFRDEDKTRKLATWFGTTDPECAAEQPALQSCYSVLDVDKAAAGSIAMHNGELSNAWRGDRYIDQIKAWVAEYSAITDHEMRRKWETGKISA